MFRIHKDFSLRSYNTFGNEVNTKYFIEFDVPEDLVSFLRSEKILRTEKRLILGGGSNLLFLNDFDGIVLHPVNQTLEVKREDSDHVWVEAGAGLKWDHFVEYCVEHGWGGVENLSLIPGNTGAVPVQNIGAYGAEASNVIEEVSGIDLENFSEVRLSASECRFGYRDSIFKNELLKGVLIQSVVFRLDRHPLFQLGYGNLEEVVLKTGEPSLRSVRQAVIRIRTEKLPDPAILGNAGSFFKNPVISVEYFNVLKASFPEIPGYPDKKGSVKLAAGWLIEQCGWKGFRKGDAGVHNKQSLVLVNHGNASGLEILELSEKISQSVYEKFNVKLEREVQVI